MKRNVERPTKGRIAFEFVSPHGLPDGDVLSVHEKGALVLNEGAPARLWSIISGEDAERLAIEVLKARGRWSTQSSPQGSAPVHSEDLTEEWEALAAALVALNSRVLEITKTLSEQEVRGLRDRCVTEAHPPPGHTHNFDVPIWGVMVYLLEQELGARTLIERLVEEEQARGISNGDGERE